MAITEPRDLGLTDMNAGCSCCAPSKTSMESEDKTSIAEDAVVADFLVEGMTCSHCVNSVTEELAAIDGVADVSVNLNVGGASRVTVASSATLDTEQVRRAIEEAGYALAQSS